MANWVKMSKSFGKRCTKKEMRHSAKGRLYTKDVNETKGLFLIKSSEAGVLVK